jgi:hypothetical protein
VDVPRRPRNESEKSRQKRDKHVAMLQLDPPLPVTTADNRTGFAHVICDYGPEYDSILLVALDDSREFWWFSHTQLRIRNNITFGRMPKS